MSIIRPTAHTEEFTTSFVISEDDPWWEPPSDSALSPHGNPNTNVEMVDRPFGDARQRPVVGWSWIKGGPVDVATTHLMLLRAFIGFAWLRAAFDKVGDRSWWDGSMVSDFLSCGSGAQPLGGLQTVAEVTLLRAPAAVAVLVLMAELLIGVGILTGLRFDAALGLGIGLAVVFLAAGRINPAAFYIVIQLALLGSPAGRVYLIDRWAPPKTIRWAPWAAGAAGLIAVWSVASAGPFSTRSVSDPASVLTFLAGFALLTFGLAWRADR